VVDNAGYELVSDLVLAHCLLTTQAADVVTLHTKAHPTFVSDAMDRDVLETIAVLRNSPLEATAQLGESFEATHFSCCDVILGYFVINCVVPSCVWIVNFFDIGRLLADSVETGRIKLVEDLFWCQPTPFWVTPLSITD